MRSLLAAWYHLRRRSLPWREEPTPYRVWISEIMLQQTQVATVIPYFERFMAAFPDVKALAEADEAHVLSLWAGLGYYRRARMLHAAAAMVVNDHGGRLPTTPNGLRELSGIGPYTANAIASIAHGFPAAVVDGNVNRVIARLTALELEVNTSAGSRSVQAFADEFLDRGDPSSHNQAMMELGALVCAPRQPRCGDCPLTSGCRAAQSGTQLRYPLKKKARRPVKILEVAGLQRRKDGAVLVARRPPNTLLGGMWELPGGGLGETRSRKKAVAIAWQQRLGLEAHVGELRASVQHVFSHRRLTLEVFAIKQTTGILAPQWYSEARWLHPDRADDVAALPLSKLTRKVFAALEIPI